MEIYYRRLPHIFIAGHPVFITTRLAGSIPNQKVLAFKQKYASKRESIQKIKDTNKRNKAILSLARQQFVDFENLLNKYASKKSWLSDARIAQIVQESFHWGDQKKYNLIAYTIMPNHIHVVLLPFTKPEKSVQKPYTVANIMESFKKFTARKANEILNRNGQFWQHESFDRLVRNHKELLRIVKYIKLNPVKAGLVQNADDYPWTYVNYDLLHF